MLMFLDVLGNILALCRYKLIGGLRILQPVGGPERVVRSDQDQNCIYRLISIKDPFAR